MYEIRKFKNSFEYVYVKNSSASAKIALQGAHIFEFVKNTEEPLLWLSDSCEFEYKKAIRGGIPVCWPWFGMNGKLPQHGFARTSLWEFVSAKESDADTTELLFRLQETKESLKLWAYRFELLLHVKISKSLEISLTTKNRDTKEFKITQALHSYFNISDIGDIHKEGMQDRDCFDALSQKYSIEKGAVSFNCEFDRVYQGVENPIILVDKNRKITIKNTNSASAIIWNPWIEKSKRMSCLRDDDYLRFVCIESANAMEDFKIIKPDESYTLKALISSDVHHTPVA
jgi:glucose-6-phosphate 1-epimerase